MGVYMKKTVRVVFLVLLMVIMGSAAIAGPASHYDIARAYYDRGKYKEAVSHLETYIAQKPDASAYYLMGYALYKLKRFDEANEYFQNAYLISPSFSPIKKTGDADQPEKPEKAPKKKTRATSPDNASPVTGQKSAVPQPKAQTPPAKAPDSPAPDSPGKQPGKEPVKVSSTDTGKPQPAASGSTAVDPAPTQQAVQPQKSQLPAQPALPQAAAKQPQAAPAPSPAATAVPKPSAPIPPLPKAQPGMPAGAGALVATPMLMGGLLAGFTLVFFGIALAIYIFFSLCMYLIAKKLNVEGAWTAWVPLLNLWAFVGSAGKPWWWILLLFVPFVNFFVVIYLWMCIVENLGKNKWLGLLMIVPLVNFVYMAVLAFSKDAALPAAPVLAKDELE
jgi:hypothetical protein